MSTNCLQDQMRNGLMIPVASKLNALMKTTQMKESFREFNKCIFSTALPDPFYLKEQN